MDGIGRGGSISRDSMDPAQVSCFYKRIATDARLDKFVIEGIIGYSIRASGTQD